MSQLRDLLESHVESGTIPGAIAYVGRLDDQRDGTDDPERLTVVGRAEVGGEQLASDAVVRIQSMTKAITTVAALRLVERGALTLDSSVEEWLPELADRRVLAHPTAALTDTVPAERAITLRHLLTNTSGYGGIVVDSPLQRAMADNGTDAGPEPVSLGADEWLARMGELPLAFQPGEGWRYHHSFGILGVLLSRVTGRPLGEHLAEDLLVPLGMLDTGYRVPLDDAHRLPAAYRLDADGLVEVEPARGGFYVGPQPFDVSHAELVSTARDYLRFLRLLVGGGVLDGVRYLSRDHLALMTTDRVPVRVRTPDDFFPGFWDGMGWGFGVGVQTAGPHAGRYGWSGGLGTDFWVDPDGTVGLLLTQVQLDERTMPLLNEFQEVR